MRLEALAGVGAFAIYAATACRTLPFGDAGELVVAASCLGVAHPPGYPLWTMLARGALAAPIGEPAFRVAILSACCAALAVSVLAAGLRRATGSPAAALGGAAALAFGATFWGAATTAEVYALHVLLLLGFLGAAWRLGTAPTATERAWAVFAAGGALGLGLSHHPTIVLAVPAAVVLGWPARRTLGARAVALAATLALALPAAFYLSLLLRSRLEPLANWGEPKTLGALFAHAAAIQYRGNDLGAAGLLRPAAWARIASWAWSDGAGGVALAATAGVAFGSHPRRLVGAALLLFAAAATFAARYAVEDVDAYLLPASVGLAVSAGIAVAAVDRRDRRAGFAAALLVAGVPFVANLGALDRRTFTAARDYGRDILATVPPGGILVFEGDDGFLPWYLQHLGGERPDVTLVDADGHLGRRIPDLPAFLRDELARPRPRAIVITNPPEFPLPEPWEARPWGLFLRLARTGDAPFDDGALWDAYRGASVLEQATRRGDFWGRTAAAWYPLGRAWRAWSSGDAQTGRRCLEEAVRIAPDSEAVRNLAGTLAATAGDLVLAEREFEAAATVKPSSWRAWANLAQAREMLGDYAGALAARREAGKLERR
ncbi:MAG TPA: DUF2723 domain-containing protein [Candidatus Polarisedimenticolaceae bacterium]